MILVKISRNKRGQIYGFTARNHSGGIVCAAVSALILNTVNSIEAFTEEALSYDIPADDTGDIELRLPDIEAGNEGWDVDLLLSSMLLGLNNIKEQYPSQITIDDPGS